jgi:DNA-binding NtrC family response regulator
MLDDVQARIETLSERLQRPEPQKPKRRKPLSGYRNAAAAREAQQRQRREMLEAEREAWEMLVEECRGDVTKIARRMGCDWYTARRALWDLGLWPMVVRERGGR